MNEWMNDSMNQWSMNQWINESMKWIHLNNKVWLTKQNNWLLW